MDKMDLDKLFKTAIEREIEAYEFYKDVAAHMKDNPTIREIFEELAAEEMGHKESLFKAQADPTLSMKIDAPEDFKIAETVDLPPLSLDMKPADAIALAMKKELQAVEFYTALSGACTDAEMKDLYTQLANMEKIHKNKLENAFVQVGYPEVW